MADEKKLSSNDRWKLENTSRYNLRIVNSSGIPNALNEASRAQRIAPTEYIRNAISEKLIREGYFPSDNLLYKLRVESNEYAMSIIEFVVNALENLKHEQELNPKLKDLTPAMAIEEMYIFSHKDIYLFKQEKLPDWFVERYPDFLKE